MSDKPIDMKDIAIYDDELKPFRYENYHHFKDNEPIAFTMSDEIQYPVICCDCGLVHWWRFKELDKDRVIFNIERAKKATEITRKMPPIRFEMLERIKKLEQQNKQFQAENERLDNKTSD